MDNAKLITNRSLDNGMDLHYFDSSKRMAGDRWLVRLQCKSAFPVLNFYYNQYHHIEPELFDALKEKMGESVSFEITKERTFVPEQDKDTVLHELIEQADSTISSYLNTPQFSEKVFIQQVEKVMQQLETERAMRSLTNRNSQLEEDEGPADFSHCFND